MKKIYKLTILIIAMAFSTSLWATNYVVSGAGTSSVNGTYVDSGTYNGNPLYRLGSTNYYLRYSGSRWEICDEWGWTTYYYTNTTGDTPPSTGWTEDIGTNPAPSVTQEGKSISYSASIFNESSANDGTITTTITITCNGYGGESFTGSNGDNFVTGAKVVVTNLPSGLTAVITRTSSTTLTASLTGTASSHNNANEISNLTFTFQNSAFSGSNAAGVSGSTKNDLSVAYIQWFNVASSGGDFTTITAALAACANGDVINVSGETFTEAGLTVNKSITIQGQGASTIVQAAASQGIATDRVFYILSATVSITGMTIRYGKTADSGSGICNYGTLTINQCTICYNDGTSYSQGGGIFTLGNLTITNSTIDHNNAYNGGGVHVGTTTTVKNTTISNNTASHYGGGIYQVQPLSLINSTICENNTGLAASGGNLTVSNSILANNGASDYGLIASSTITNNGYNIVENQTVISGGGAGKFLNTTDILYNYKADGTAGTAWTRNSATMGNQNFNISSTLALNSTTNGTQTLALSSGSFAIDAGTATGAPTTDQRGASRNGTTDIGAYEYGGVLPNQWTGSTSADWATATNWSYGTVPVSSTDISIPNVPNDPVISATTSASCNNLSVQSGATLTIQSDATNSGSLIVAGTSTGNVTYNRYITGSKWHLGSSPVGGQSINTLATTVANSIAFINPKYGIAPYNNATPGWAHYTTGTIAGAGNFVAGQGYEVLRTSDGTVASTGTVATTDVNIDITKSANGWNLVGNPFTSAINGANVGTNFLTVNADAIDNNYEAVYVWDAANSVYNTINNTSGATYIAPGQAFFVYSALASTSIDFTEAMQTHQTGDIFKSGEIPPPSINLVAESGKNISSTNIKYFGNTTTGLDPGYDAGRFSGGDNSFAVYTHLVGDKTNLVDFDIQCLPLGEYSHVIPVGLNAPENTELVFRAESMNLPALTPVILEDKVSGTFTDLTGTGSFYSVKTVAKAAGTGRFFIHTEKSTSTGIEPVSAEGNFTIIPRPQYNTLHIIGKADNQAVLSVYDMLGRQQLNRTLTQSGINDVDMGGLTSGAYIVFIRSSTQKVSKKISWIKN